MQLPLQITLRDIPGSESVEAHIRKKAEKLDQYHERITSCRVVVERPRRHQHQGERYSVRIDTRVPGAELVVNRDKDEDVYVAIRDAFDAMARQLEDYSRKQRGAVKARESAQRGRVARLLRDEGYGFIETPDGRELYFHGNNLVTQRFEDLSAGDEVTFIEEVGAEGPQAHRVSLHRH